MFKKIIIHILIGVAITIFGLIFSLEFHRLGGIGLFIAFSGIGYAIISVIAIPLNWKPLSLIEKVYIEPLVSFFEKSTREKEKNKALDELRVYKKLLDEGILSQDEFIKKSEELKKKIL